MNVAELRIALASVDGDIPIWVHDGWTFPIDGWDLDGDGFILYVDKDGLTATQVNREAGT